MKLPKFLAEEIYNSFALLKLEKFFTLDNNSFVPLVASINDLGRLPSLFKKVVPPSIAPVAAFPPLNRPPIKAPSTAPSIKIPIE